MSSSLHCSGHSFFFMAYHRVEATTLLTEGCDDQGCKVEALWSLLSPSDSESPPSFGTSSHLHFPSITGGGELDWFMASSKACSSAVRGSIWKAPFLWSGWQVWELGSSCWRVGSIGPMLVGAGEDIRNEAREGRVRIWLNMYYSWLWILVTHQESKKMTPQHRIWKVSCNIYIVQQKKASKKKFRRWEKSCEINSNNLSHHGDSILRATGTYIFCQSAGWSQYTQQHRKVRGSPLHNLYQQGKHRNIVEHIWAWIQDSDLWRIQNMVQWRYMQQMTRYNGTLMEVAVKSLDIEACDCIFELLDVILHPSIFFHLDDWWYFMPGYHELFQHM